MISKTLRSDDVNRMTPYQWIRLILVYLLIPAVLLSCGGDLGWRQAWVFSLLIVAAAIVGRL